MGPNAHMSWMTHWKNVSGKEGLRQRDQGGGGSAFCDGHRPRPDRQPGSHRRDEGDGGRVEGKRHHRCADQDGRAGQRRGHARPVAATKGRVRSFWPSGAASARSVGSTRGPPTRAYYLGRTTKVPCMLGWCLVQMIGNKPGLRAVKVTRVISPRFTVKESTTPGIVEGCTSPLTPRISSVTVSPCRTTMVPGDHWYVETSHRPPGLGGVLIYPAPDGRGV